MAEPRAGLIEVLLPVLDELCRDLIEMDHITAIVLETWPAADEFVALWRDHMPAEAVDG